MPIYNKQQEELSAEAINAYSVAREQFFEAIKFINLKFHTGVSIKMQYAIESYPNKNDAAIFFLKGMKKNNDGDFTLDLDLLSIIDETDEKLGLMNVIFFTSNNKDLAMGEHIRNVQNYLIEAFRDDNADGFFDGLDGLFQKVVIDKDYNEGHGIDELHMDCIYNIFADGLSPDWCNLLNPELALHEYFFGSTAPRLKSPIVTGLDITPAVNEF